MRKLMLFGLAALVALGITTGSASAGGVENCPTGECQTQPAQFVVTGISVEKTHGHGSGTKHISVKQIKHRARKIEKKKHVYITFYENEKGVHNDTCVDPTKMHWGFHAGDVFINHRESGPYKTIWVAGWKVCEWEIVKKGGRYWAKGTKANCGNSPIWIPIHFHLSKARVKKTWEFKSYKAFWEKKVNHKTVKTTSTSEFENIVETGHYVCPSGWHLVEGGNCKYCPPPPPCPPPHEPECEYGSVWSETEQRCVKNGETTPEPPAEAPGENPPPSGGEGDPGSNQCYDEITGEPVEPVEGLCPPGSYGEY